MPHSFSQIYIHVVFGAKYRSPAIPEYVVPRLYEFMVGIMKASDCPVLRIGGTNDHLHMLFCLSRKVSLAKVVEQLKSKSSLWLRSEGPEFRDFRWQPGYGAFSVSQSNVGHVIRYIENQASHHRKMSFSDE